MQSGNTHRTATLGSHQSASFIASRVALSLFKAVALIGRVADASFTLHCM
jgi:hypothetical protein